MHVCWLTELRDCAGEVSSGVLTANGKDYLITVGQHGNKDPKNGVTFIYDIAEDVRVLSLPDNDNSC